MAKIGTKNPIYKGIAIFGAPGTGKTTVAMKLLRLIPRTVYVEASEMVIRPALQHRDKLPEGEAAFCRWLSKQGRQRHKSFSRDAARDFFITLKNKYSASVIAKALIYQHEKNFSKSFAIVAGIRGYRNAMYFKKHGYLVIYLKAPGTELNRRLARREVFSKKKAEKERQIEERLFSTNKVNKIAHFSFDTMASQKQDWMQIIKALIEPMECKRCVNSSVNLSSTIDPLTGLCETCALYARNFSRKQLEKEKKVLLSFKNGAQKYDCMVGISGGKDSTATLSRMMQMGFHPLAFTFDSGYYPKHIFSRAKKIAEQLGVDFVRIDIQKSLRAVDRESFQQTAALYDEKDSEALKEKFRTWYVEGRRHYSIKCHHALPFIRTCQLCRRMVIRAYYAEAQSRGIPLVVLGMNEWAGLSQDPQSKKAVFSAIRKLHPHKNKPAVTIVHLPFLFQQSIDQTHDMLRKLGWKIPRGEKLIESNANSCLFARAAESKARRLLGFHPDTTRLAREVTVGFITKGQAKKALKKIHRSRYSVRQILEQADII